MRSVLILTAALLVGGLIAGNTVYTKAAEDDLDGKLVTSSWSKPTTTLPAKYSFAPKKTSSTAFSKGSDNVKADASAVIEKLKTGYVNRWNLDEDDQKTDTHCQLLDSMMEDYDNDSYFAFNLTNKNNQTIELTYSDLRYFDADAGEYVLLDLEMTIEVTGDITDVYNGKAFLLIQKSANPNINIAGVEDVRVTYTYLDASTGKEYENYASHMTYIDVDNGQALRFRAKSAFKKFALSENTELTASTGSSYYAFTTEDSYAATGGINSSVGAYYASPEIIVRYYAGVSSHASGDVNGAWSHFGLSSKSMVDYEIADPVKRVYDTTTGDESVNEGDANQTENTLEKGVSQKFVYHITQEVPQLDGEDIKWNSLIFTEDLDDGLEPYIDSSTNNYIIRVYRDKWKGSSTAGTKVYDYNGGVSDPLFECTTMSDGKIVVKATTEALADADFYGHSYTLVINVQIKSAYRTIDGLYNWYQSFSHYSGASVTTDSSDVTTAVIPNRASVTAGSTLNDTQTVNTNIVKTTVKKGFQTPTPVKRVYDLTDETKTKNADETDITLEDGVGQRFIYEISQKVPARVTESDGWDSFVFYDDLEDIIEPVTDEDGDYEIEVLKDGTVIWDYESDGDGLFAICSAVSDRDGCLGFTMPMQVSASDSLLSSDDFYGHTYTLRIRMGFKEEYSSDGQEPSAYERLMAWTSDHTYVDYDNSAAGFTENTDGTFSGLFANQAKTIVGSDDTDVAGTFVTNAVETIVEEEESKEVIPLKTVTDADEEAVIENTLTSVTESYIYDVSVDIDESNAGYYSRYVIEDVLEDVLVTTAEDCVMLCDGEESDEGWTITVDEQTVTAATVDGFAASDDFAGHVWTLRMRVRIHTEAYPDRADILAVLDSDGNAIASLSDDEYTLTIPNTAKTYATTYLGNSIKKETDPTQTKVSLTHVETTKDVDRFEHQTGDLVSYTITARQTVKDSAAQTVIEDTVPEGLSLIEDSIAVVIEDASEEDGDSEEESAQASHISKVRRMSAAVSENTDTDISDTEGTEETDEDDAGSESTADPYSVSTSKSASGTVIAVCIDSLAYGQTAVITYQAKGAETGEGTVMVNTAVATIPSDPYAIAVGENDPDWDPTRSAEEYTGSSSERVWNNTPDLSIEKTADAEGEVEGGTVITYLLEIRNKTDGTLARNIRIEDVIDSDIAELVAGSIEVFDADGNRLKNAQTSSNSSTFIIDTHVNLTAGANPLSSDIPYPYSYSGTDDPEPDFYNDWNKEAEPNRAYGDWGQNHEGTLYDAYEQALSDVIYVSYQVKVGTETAAVSDIENTAYASELTLEQTVTDRYRLARTDPELSAVIKELKSGSSLTGVLKTGDRRWGFWVGVLAAAALSLVLVLRRRVKR